MGNTVIEQSIDIFEVHSNVYRDKKNESPEMEFYYRGKAEAYEQAIQVLKSLSS